MHISVCICTYRRPTELKRLLSALSSQETKNLFTFSVVIADNDREESAKKAVIDFAAGCSLQIAYCVEPRRSIALARNKSLEHAKGDRIAFIDDDEVPIRDWLANLLTAQIHYKASGVLGPVRAYFETKAPEWVVKSRLQRPEHPTGFLIPWTEGRTGNALIRKDIIEGMREVFQQKFETGGSDTDLFYRLTKAGHQFIWCNEAVVYEVVPPHHWKRKHIIKRALLRGKNSQMDPERRLINNLKALVAIPAYILVLPVMQFCGHDFFMRYLIKLCIHTGLLLALVGIKPVRDREV